MADIILNKIQKSYNGKVVFDGLDLAIKEGEITVLNQPSGWGKTTLLSMLMGITKPDRGSISGLDSLKLSAVFQENRLIDSLCVGTNIRMVSPGISHKECQKALDELELSDCYDMKVSELSGGMKRRVSLIRALMHEYDVLLLDEPFTGLDNNTKEKTIEYTKKVTAGKTIVFASHDLYEIELMTT